jgi:nucleolar MIF4G domain-containing protein 1
MYEGIGGKFGDFLMQLDDFAQYAKSDATPSEKKSFLSVNDSDSESDNEVRDEVPRLLNDSDQEASDLEMDLSDSDSDDDDDDDEEEEEEEDEEEEEVEEGEGWFDDADEYAVAGHDYSRNRSNSGDSGSDDEGDSGSDSGSDDGDSSGDEDDFPEQDHAPGSTYRPVQGEDIYGRVVDSGAGSSTTTSKYMPPAVRKKMEEEAARKAGTTSTGSATKTVGAAAFTIDDNSEQSRLLKRKINGQLNRLSEQSRDSIVKGLQEIFAQNSFTLCCHILKDCLLSVCSNSTQLMNTLIPHYAGLIAALHHSVDFQIGSYVLESLVVKLYSVSFITCMLSLVFILYYNIVAYFCGF